MWRMQAASVIEHLQRHGEADMPWNNRIAFDNVNIRKLTLSEYCQSPMMEGET
jgi:predicted ATPase